MWLVYVVSGSAKSGAGSPILGGAKSGIAKSKSNTITHKDVFMLHLLSEKFCYHSIGFINVIVKEKFEYSIILDTSALWIYRKKKPDTFVSGFFLFHQMNYFRMTTLSVSISPPAKSFTK